MSLNFTFPKECKTKDFTLSVTLEETRSLNSDAIISDSEYGELYRKDLENLGMYSFSDSESFFGKNHPGLRLIKNKDDGIILNSQFHINRQNHEYILDLKMCDIIIGIQLDPFYVDEKTTYHLSYINNEGHESIHTCKSGDRVPLFISPHKGRLTIKGVDYPSLCCNVEYVFLATDRRRIRKN